jgi:cell division protease FtsH
MVRDSDGMTFLSGELKPQPNLKKNDLAFSVNVLPSENLENFLIEHKVPCPLVYRNDWFGKMLPEMLWFGVGMVIVGFLFFRFFRSANSSAMNFGKSRAKMMSQDCRNVRFSDVGGVAEAKEEVQEIVEFLKSPAKFRKLGGRIPKGVLMMGPPGTGKTLLAKAIAGESGVPFFSISGSDFIEMYVGLGAKRVRQLFKKAREAAPCIVFIDEIDAVGGSRNAAASHAEANQTINALLNELDGFNGKEGILVIAATNRLEDLDPALIRPGRFDKQLAVPLPEKEDRIAILKVHARNKTFEDDVNWDEIAATTVGFSGAAIASMLNEAAFIAASQRRDKISMNDIDRAIYKLLMKGDQKEDQSTRSKKELEICAYHESGHVIATKLYTNDRIPKVTIISSTSGAGGVTFRTPEETGLVSKAYLEGSVKMMYAGRAAEEIYFGNTDMITTGASSDIKQATEIIKSYIGVYGMSDEYGLINLAAFNNVNQEELIQKASTLAKTLYNEVRDDISRNKELLEKLSTELLAHESLSESEIESIFNAIGLNK